MTSIGNDIVALAGTNAQRASLQRFYNKILLPNELQIYTSGKLPGLSLENYVWLLWSVKESVYKFTKRTYQHITFCPQKIIVQSVLAPVKTPLPLLDVLEMDNISYVAGECYCGHILSPTGMYYSRSIINSQFIYTVVNSTEDFGCINWGIKQIDDNNPENQSGCVRSFVSERLRALLPKADIYFTKSMVGYPVLHVDGNETTIPVSFTHHGRFVAYALQLPASI